MALRGLFFPHGPATFWPHKPNTGSHTRVPETCQVCMIAIIRAWLLLLVRLQAPQTSDKQDHSLVFFSIGVADTELQELCPLCWGV